MLQCLSEAERLYDNKDSPPPLPIPLMCRIQYVHEWTVASAPSGQILPINKWVKSRGGGGVR
jgi:hypothetical protein